MAAVASIISIVLFLAFFTAGVQKVLFNPLASEVAGRLEFTKKAYQRIGGVEIAGGVAMLAGLSAKGSSWLALANEAAAVGLALTMGLAIYFHFRVGDKFKVYAAPLSLGVLALIELIFRLAQ